LNTDFLIIILKDLLARRKDLKLVLMSATLNADSFSSFFGVCPVVSIPGRAHPVKENRLEDILELTGYKVLEGSDYVPKLKSSAFPKISKSALRSLYYPKYSKDTIHSLSIVDETVINYELLAKLLEHISLNEGDGAILVFCPGLQEIQKTIEELYKKEFFQSSKVLIYPLHSSLSTAEQTAIFQIPPQGIRKIVVSTSKSYAIKFDMKPIIGIYTFEQCIHFLTKLCIPFHQILLRPPLRVSFSSRNHQFYLSRYGDTHPHRCCCSLFAP
jgi:ATP-dependent RNA helicase DHX29